MNIEQSPDLFLFRNNLKRIRVSKGFTGESLSREIDLRQVKRISDIEDGRGKPSLDEIMLICKFLEVSIDSMLYKKVDIQINFV